MAALMQLEEGNDWLAGVRKHLSPNRDERPDSNDISLLVVHGISLPPGEFGGGYIDHLFMNTLDAGAHPYFAEIAGNPVSAHVLVDRQGEVTQYVPFTQRAWHAGQSGFAGRSRCNDYSIGIELEGCDDQPYTHKQYEQLVAIARALMATWPTIEKQRIVGHCHIAPGRKTDPGPAFDWDYLYSLLDELN